jgi:hypothetical protein
MKRRRRRRRAKKWKRMKERIEETRSCFDWSAPPVTCRSTTSPYLVLVTLLFPLLPLGSRSIVHTLVIAL